MVFVLDVVLKIVDKQIITFSINDNQKNFEISHKKKNPVNRDMIVMSPKKNVNIKENNIHLMVYH